ncbi:uncharacterized protein BP5553_09860 [Venustampulla echinocandica]|uniref:Uncharacterized protein n=1 Tax=Venustampulla echinocandica TaxID=2656787 RepID=A0A370TAW3_9HELO|nr:uncharacterized protein BP5553_09860 [Venustampulla echinocandica]RDL31071.1 hypothetical protein BP5553_09860 [Venustampulla echinocandica]
MADHRRSRSVSVVRLSQSLPPLPGSPDAIAFQTLAPYRDEPEQEQQSGEDEEDESKAMTTPRAPDSQPPEYEPMYDYLRSKTPEAPQAYGTSPPHGLCLVVGPAPQEPYRDEPLQEPDDDSQHPPPSYQDLYRERERDIELGNLERELGLADSDPQEQVEDIFKWLVAMLIIILTLAAVATAFNVGGHF